MMSIFQIRRLALGAVMGVGLVNIAAFTALAEPVEPLSHHDHNPTGRTVVDSTGKLVGLLISSGVYDNLVELQIKNQWVIFGIGTAGLDSSSGLGLLFFTDQNCQSQPYVAAEQTPPYGFLRAFNVNVNYTSYFFDSGTHTYVSSGTLIYPSLPHTILTIANYGGITSLSPLTVTCYKSATNPFIPRPLLVGPMATVDLGPFTPPFSVK
jgi:hypothetical protein